MPSGPSGLIRADGAQNRSVMSRKAFSRAVGFVAVAAFVLTSSGSAFAAGDAKKGEALYGTQKCSMCHSVAGKGNKKYPLDGVGAKLSAADIKEWLINPDAQHAKKGDKPVMKMKSYKSLSADDIDSLVAYVQTLK
jgi:mono/diheme cytochrome c family protein